jgi:hypothetical protein
VKNVTNCEWSNSADFFTDIAVTVLVRLLQSIWICGQRRSLKLSSFPATHAPPPTHTHRNM